MKANIVFSLLIGISTVLVGCSKDKQLEELEESKENHSTVDYRAKFVGNYYCSGIYSHYFSPSENKPSITRDTILFVSVTILKDSDLQFSLNRNPEIKLGSEGDGSGYHIYSRFYDKDSIYIFYKDGGLGEGSNYVLYGKRQ